MSATAVVVLAVDALRARVAWWIVLPLAVVGGGLLVWQCFREGRVQGVREEALESGEILMSAYRVHPVNSGPPPVRWPESSSHELRVTTYGLQRWDGDQRLWAHPWRAVALAAEGKLLVVRHEGRVVERLQLDTMGGAPDELLLAAERLRRRGGGGGRA
ncbi:hypothetical protein [Streptomyces sp. NPDC046887]|uniref:hypothetical protein n=1 Tax=Streptomyces sp. NPDC046887 TaxID=3155472 RepID=UPI0033E010A8